MARKFLLRRLYAVEWDGTNGAEVAQLMQDADASGTVYSVHAEIPGSHLTIYGHQGGVYVGQQTMQASRPCIVLDMALNILDFWTVADVSNKFMPGDATAGTVGLTLSQVASGLLADPGFVSSVRGRQYLAAKTATIPAAALLSSGTRTVNVSWGRDLGTSSYEVDILTDNTLSVGTPYTFSAGTKTGTGFALSYTNSSVLTLGSGVLHCIAWK